MLPVRTVATKKTPPRKAAPKEPDESAEVGWTLRMPRELAEQVKARAAALTALGRGKWTGNMVMVDAIANAAKSWNDKEETP